MELTPEKKMIFDFILYALWFYLGYMFARRKDL